MALVAVLRSSRANFHLRMVRPRLSDEVVQAHDDAVWKCFCHLVGHRRRFSTREKGSWSPNQFGRPGLVSGIRQRRGRALGQLG